MENTPAQFSVRFSGSELSAKDIIANVEENVSKIKTLAQDVGMEKIIVSSKNYSISNESNAERSFNYNGSVSFSVTPANTAWKLLDLLEQEHFKASMSVNAQTCGAPEYFNHQ